LKKDPTSSSCASSGRILQKFHRPWKLFIGIMLLKTVVYGWYSHFKCGQGLLEDELHSGILSTSVNAETIWKVKELVCADQHITISEAVNEVGRSYWSAQTVLTGEWHIKWDKIRWILHHDNAANHLVMAVQQFLMYRQIVLILQPLFSEDLTPYDFWLFPRQRNGASESMFCDTRRCQLQCDGWPAHYTKGVFSWVLPSMPKLLEQVCVCRRDVPREWLDWNALHFNYLSFMAEFWELYDMNMYMDIFWLIYVSEQSAQICNSMWTYCGEMFFTSSVLPVVECTWG